MTRMRFAMISAVILFSSIVVGLSLLNAADPATPAAAGTDFGGKILVLGAKSSHEYGASIENVTIKRIGDRDFFVGKWTTNDGTPTWQSGQTIWTPVDDVSYIVVFDNVEQLKKAYGDRRE